MNGLKAFLAVFVLIAATGFVNAADYINVTLEGPDHGNWNATVSNLNFTFNISTNLASIASCYLYTNASGTWGISTSNQTPITNGSVRHGMYNFTIPTNNTIIWNVNCTNNDTSVQNRSDGNWTLNFDNSEPIITVSSPANNTWQNNLTASFPGGNITVAFNVTGINSNNSQVNCSVALNDTSNHTNATLTGFGVTREMQLRLPANQTSRFNISCQTLAGTNRTNDTMYYDAFYWAPRVSFDLDVPPNNSWTNNQTINFTFSNNHSFYDIYGTHTLNCSIYFNSTLNDTNASVTNNTDDNVFTVAGLGGAGRAYEGLYVWNVTCADPAGNIGYNSLNVNIDRSVNYSNIETNSTAYSGISVEHRVYWTDAYNLSGYVFGSNYTGSWVNDSWVQLVSGTETYLNNWTNVSKTMSGSMGSVWGWRVWMNDSLGNWDDTGMQTLMVIFQSGGASGGATSTPTASPTAAPTAAPTVTPTPAPTPTEVPTEAPPAEGATATQANDAIEAALALIDEAAAQGADVSDAQEKLDMAMQASAAGDYDSAVAYALQAENLAREKLGLPTVSAAATATPSPAVEAPAAAGFDWSTMLWVVVILVVVVAGYYYFAKPKRKGL